jgi:exopolysaccharide biosynthesis polyprenyl glycosylphosphotransferase
VATIIIAPENEQESTTLSLLYRLFPLNIPIKISPDTLSLLTSPIRLQNIYEEPLIDISSADISEATKNIKRLLDIIMSLTALIILAVPMLIVALIIRLDSKGGIFYSQERIGYRQKPFYIRKFRTMRVDAESNGPQLSSENDSRITRVGRVLRKYRIDELPQFWNVLIGEMSMVGPRPERAFFIRQIVKKAPYYTLIHQVRPGITSWGMVKYGYAQNVDEMILRLRYDLIYLTNISIMVDLKIIIYTVKTVFTGRGM